MTKYYTRTTYFFILLTLFFGLPSLLKANNTNPIGIEPTLEDSIQVDTIWIKDEKGHLKCIIRETIDCKTKTVKLEAYFHFLFTGVFQPIEVPWSEGTFGHEITVKPPGIWSYDDAGYGCDHHNTTIELDAFFEDTLKIDGPKVICPGIPDTLFVDDYGYDFKAFGWNPPHPDGEFSPYFIDKPGSYTITATDQMNCPHTAKITVLPSPPVLPNLFGPKVMCSQGDTGIITLTPAFHAYLWSTGETTQNITIFEPGFYDVTVTNQYGCTNDKQIVIQNGDVGLLDILATKPAICPGQNDTLMVNGGYIKYEWSTSQTGIRIVVNQPGTYTVTVTNTYGCTGTEEVVIGLLPTPKISLSNTPLCPNGNATISVTNGPYQQYNWSNAAKTPTINITTPGVYTVTVSGKDICPTSTQIAVAVTPPPISIIADPLVITCASPQINLDGTASTKGPKIGLNWTTTGGNFTGGQNTYQPSIDKPGTYILSLVDSTSQCRGADTVAVIEDKVPPGANAGAPGILDCKILSLIIGGTPPPNINFAPAWTTSNGNFASGQNSWNPVVDKPGTYTLQVKNNINGCTSLASVIITEDKAKPIAAILKPDVLSCTQNKVTLSGTGSSTGLNIAYQWSTNNGSLVPPTNGINSTASSKGVYELLVTNTTNNCTATATTTVDADINIPLVFAEKPDTLNCKVKSIVIDASSSSQGASMTYNWATIGGKIENGGNTLKPEVSAPGIYNLTLFNLANNCIATLAVEVAQDIANPVADAGKNAILNCNVTSIQLNANASSQGTKFTYQWTTTDGKIVSGDKSLTPTINQLGTYNLLVTNKVNGCTATSSVKVDKDANAPVAVIAPAETLTCVVKQININAKASTSGPNITYQWAGTGITAGGTTNEPTVNQPGTFTVTISNTQNGCSDVETVIVPEDVVAPNADAGTDVLINCKSPTGTLGNANNPAAGVFNLVWSTTGGNFTSPANQSTVKIDKAGVYQVSITNTKNGCTDVDNVVVTDDFVKPTADAGVGTELNCVLTSFVLQGTGSVGQNFVYEWTTTGGNIVKDGTTLLPTINAAGTYNLLVTNNVNGCTQTDQVQITQSADVPVAVAGQPQTLNCNIKSVALNGTGSTTGATIGYTWSTVDGNIVTGNTSLLPQVDRPGTYVIQVLNSANNCKAVSSVLVKEDIEKPVVDAGKDNTLTCKIRDFTLEALIKSSSSQNIGYAWATTGGQIANGATTPKPSVTAKGLYTVTVTDNANGCTSTDVIEILEDVVKPTSLIANPKKLNCIVKQINLDAKGSSFGPQFAYLWATGNGNIVNQTKIQEPEVNRPGVYNLTITNSGNDCTQTASVTVTEDVQLPTAEAGQVFTLNCKVTSLQLDGDASSKGAFFTHTWSTSNGNIVSGGSSTKPTIDKPGDYTILVKNTDNGCEKSDEIEVKEDVVKPALAITTPKILTCIEKTALLDGMALNTGTTPLITWKTANGNFVGNTTNLNANVDKPGTYTLTVLNQSNQCETTVNVDVKQDIVVPPVQVQPAPKLTCTVKQINLTGSTAPQMHVLWSTTNGNIVSGGNTLKPTVDKPGTYQLLITSVVNGCSSTDQVIVLAETDIPQSLDFELDPPSCDGSLGVVEVTDIDGGVGPFLYSIDAGKTFFPPKEFDKLKPGDYTLVIQDANGCEIDEVIKVPAPIFPAIGLPKEFSIQLGDEQKLVAILPPPFTTAMVKQVVWSPKENLTFDGTSIEDQLQPTAKPFKRTEYTVTIFTEEGCKAVARTTIKVDKEVDIYVPNIIKPDLKDGVNQSFTIFARDKSVDKINSLQVYDRWGTQVFLVKDLLPGDSERGWDGTYNGSPMNPGVFAWWAEVLLVDGNKILLKGDVTIYR